MFEKTWIGATGQRWKVYVMFGLMALTISLFVLAMYLIDRTEPAVGTLILLTFLCVAMTFFLWTFFAINCPFCGSRVIWNVLRTLPHQESIYVAFFSLTHCPSCKGSFFEKSATSGRSSTD